jgi:hypothetical protein
MITQTYTFRNLPKAIIQDENDRGLQWTRGIEEDIKWEIGEYHNTRWSPDVTGADMILTVEVEESNARFLECLLHNLHSGKLLETTNTNI